jgi:hypothetical protein
VKLNHQVLQVVAVGLECCPQQLLPLAFHPVLAVLAADVAVGMAGLVCHQWVEAPAPLLHHCHHWVVVWVLDDGVLQEEVWWWCWNVGALQVW